VSDIDDILAMVEKAGGLASRMQREATDAANTASACEDFLASAAAALQEHECDGEIEPPPTEDEWLYRHDGWRLYPDAAEKIEQVSITPDALTIEAWVYPTRAFPAGRPLGICQAGDWNHTAVAVWLGEQRVHAQRPYVSTLLTYPIEGRPVHVAWIAGDDGSGSLIVSGRQFPTPSIGTSPIPGPLYIGSTPMHKGETRFHGALGNLTVWPYARSIAQIRESIEVGPPPGELPPLEVITPPPPVGDWPALPVTTSSSDGGLDPARNPAARPADRAVIEGVHYTRWMADSPRREGGGGGLAAVIDGGLDRNPARKWTARNCRFTDCRNGDAVRSHGQIVLERCLWENVEDVAVDADSTAQLFGRDLTFRNCASGFPETIWWHAGPWKITGGGAAAAGAPAWVDLDRVLVDRAWNGPYGWVDWRVNIRRLHNMIMMGGCRWRGIQIEMSAGEKGRDPHFANVQIGHACQQPSLRPSWTADESIFNAAFLVMTSGGFTAENITIVTMPTPSSAFAFQDQAGTVHGGREGAHQNLPFLDAMTVTRDIHIKSGLFVLRGPNSTLSRAYAQPPGADDALKRIRVDGEVWVEADSQSAADARARTFGAGTLTVRAMTKAAIEAGLRERGLGHLL